MPDRRIIEAYRYDGSFDGLLCCVFEAISRREQPADIFSRGGEQLSLCPPRDIETDPAKAGRVLRSIPAKISPEALSWVRQGFLSCEPRRETLILDFLRKGYRAGPSVTRMLQDETVSALWKAVRFTGNEAHLLKGFIRFTERGGVLTSVIDPKNTVLPLLAQHFAERLPREKFLIYDRTHGMALVHRPGQCRILPAEEIEFAPESPEEEAFRAMWRQFYKTIAIEGRYNPRCRMTHCPKRYWQNMTELCGEMAGTPSVPEGKNTDSPLSARILAEIPANL